MLFPYRPVPDHAMEKMHQYVDFIFHQIWCLAPEQDYGLELFEAHPDLHEIIQGLEAKDRAGKLKSNGAGYQFLRNLNLVFSEFKKLTPSEIEDYQTRFAANNNLEDLCQNLPDCQPSPYSSLPDRPALNAALHKFYSTLYSSGFFGLKRVREKLGSDLKSYYRDFAGENKRGICPFCGLSPMRGKFTKSREANDHFLPKSKYPFNSVNLLNLAPACSTCNSGYKGDTDPLFDKNNQRRKAINPFGSTSLDFSIHFDLQIKDWENMNPEQLNLTIDSDSHPEETDTWKNLYGVEERYQDFLCSSEEGVGCYYWYTQVLDEWKEDGRHPSDHLDTLRRQTALNPIIEHKFLKLPFLESCQQAGLYPLSQPRK